MSAPAYKFETFLQCLCTIHALFLLTAAPTYHSQFPLEDYAASLLEMEGLSSDEVVSRLRRGSVGFARSGWLKIGLVVIASLPNFSESTSISRRALSRHPLTNSSTLSLSLPAEALRSTAA